MMKMLLMQRVGFGFEAKLCTRLVSLSEFSGEDGSKVTGAQCWVVAGESVGGQDSAWVMVHVVKG